MEEKREMEYFNTLYQHIKVKNKQIKKTEEEKNSDDSDEKSEISTPRMKEDLDENETIDEEIIKQGLSTFGQTVDCSYSFLSCNISNKNVNTLNGIQNYPKLENLSCSGNALEDVTYIHSLKNLFFLDLSRNRINRIYSSRISKRLVTLDLSHNLLKKLPNLSCLTFLKVFRASHNCLSSLGEIHHEHLEELILDNNRIARIDGPFNLPLLQTLDLSFNELFDISPLSSLENLQILRLNKNLITTLNSLQSLNMLIELELACNSISSLDEISLLSTLSLLSALDLSMNFCQSLKFYRFQIIFMLPSLTVLDGQPVDPKEQVKADCFFDQFIDMEKNIFLEELPQEKFIDKRVFMYNLVMKTHMSPRIDLSLKDIFGTSEQLLQSPLPKLNANDNKFN
jgi:hypothetical protein